MRQFHNSPQAAGSPLKRTSFGYGALLITALVQLPSPALAGNNGFTGGFVGGVVGGMVGQAIQQQQYYQQQQQQYYQQQQMLQQQQYYQQQQLQQQQYYQQQKDAVREEERQRYLAKKKAQQEKAKQQQPDQAKLNPPAADSTGAAPIAITMKQQGGTLWVPAQINKAVAIDFIVDSGAADVTIPKDVFKTLIRSGTLSEKDVIGKGKFGTADGSEVEGVRFKLATLQVGDQTITDVVASVIPSSSDSAQPLLGQSFLSRFQSWSIDNKSGTLNLIPEGGAPAAGSPPTQTAEGRTPAAISQQPQPVGTGSAAVASATSSEATAPAATPTQKIATTEANATANSPANRQDSDAAPATKSAEAAPSFPPNTAYADARRSLMALGYEPAPLPDAEKCDRGTDKTCFPEREACQSENGNRCEFLWKRGERLIKVTTIADPPTVSAVGCQINCQ